MSEITRYERKYDLAVDCHCSIVEHPDGEYVLYDDHLADRAELLRLLERFRETHNVHTDCRDLRERGEKDYRCSLCKQVDALTEKGRTA